MSHLDVVSNNWMSGQQNLLGRVVAGADGPVIESEDAGVVAWIARAFTQLRSDNAALSTEKLLEELGSRYSDGSYMFVLGPHAESDCPFSGTSSIHMTSHSVSPIEHIDH